MNYLNISLGMVGTHGLTFKGLEVEVLADLFESHDEKCLESKCSQLMLRGGARNFGLGGSSCDANILVKTNLYTHMYIN